MVTRTQGDFLLGTIIGTVLGAATALLLSPTSGEKLRKKVAEHLKPALRKKFAKQAKVKSPTKKRSRHKKVKTHPHAE